MCAIISPMQRFVDDDTGYQRWLAEHPEQFVVNTYREPRASYLRLHRATCTLISGTPANGVHWTANYIKFCGTDTELRRWAKRDVGGDVWECSRCI